MRIHFGVGILAVALGFIFRIENYEWLALVIVIGFVFILEIINTAIETLADHLHPGQHPEIGVVKDVAAGAVLVASVVAVIVGLAYLATLLPAMRA